MIYRCDHETRSLRCMGDSVPMLLYNYMYCIPVYIYLHVHRSDVDHDDWLVFDNILEVLVEVC